MWPKFSKSNYKTVINFVPTDYHRNSQQVEKKTPPKSATSIASFNSSVWELVDGMEFLNTATEHSEQAWSGNERNSRGWYRSM